LGRGHILILERIVGMAFLRVAASSNPPLEGEGAKFKPSP